jgi:putative glutathione S-transferase
MESSCIHTLTLLIFYLSKPRQSEIIRMLNSEFNAFAKNPDLDAYPEDMRDAIDKVNEWIYPTINNGVYRCGFARSQGAYDAAITELTDSFDRIDQILQKQRFIAGDRFTEADTRLFVTLVRFDEVYAVYFKTNTRSCTYTPSILNYLREIYQMPGVKDTVNMEQIKAHYYCSHPTLNHYSIIPRGSNFVGLLEEPHNRDTVNKM